MDSIKELSTIKTQSRPQLYAEARSDYSEEHIKHGSVTEKQSEVEEAKLSSRSKFSKASA